jgi:tetratricopeptide (TPR) repeat protein
LRLLALLLVGVGWLLISLASLYDGWPRGLLWRSAYAQEANTTHQPAAQSVALRGFTHEWQTLNNCGPAVLAMNLRYFGDQLDQHIIAETLRPNSGDQNVRPDELARYAIERGYEALLRINGDAERLRLLLSNGIPVIIETWESDDPNNLAEGFAHFRLITGYDDTRQVWIAHDPYFARDLINAGGAYAGMTVPYAYADQMWQVTNRKYVVVYPQRLAPLVESILGDEMNDEAMWQRSLRQAQAEVEAQPKNSFAWFNLGSSLYHLDLAAEAVQAFEHAAILGLPERMHWYQYEPLQAYYATGAYQKVLALTRQNLAVAVGIEELHYWRALSLAALGAPDKAQQALRQALAIKPNYGQALAALESGFGS